MQTKNPRRLELKGIFFFVALFSFCLLHSVSAAQRASETPEEKAQVDKALASQEKGRPIEGRALKKLLGNASSEKVIKGKIEFKKLEPMKSKATMTRPPIKRVLGAEEAKSAVRKKVAEKGKAEEKAMELRESQFKPEVIKKPLQ